MTKRGEVPQPGCGAERRGYRATGTGWTCHLTGGTVTRTHRAHLAAGAHSTVTVRARVMAKAGQALTSTATVAPPDATPADNTASDVVRVAARRA